MTKIDKTYYNKAFKIAIPCIIETFLTSIVWIIDGIMVGSLGPVATAAVGIHQPLTWLITSLQAGISIGTVVLVAMHYGKEEIDKASNVASQGLAVTACFGLLVFSLVFSLSGQITALLGAKPEVLPFASMYLRTYSVAIPFQYVVFTCACILRGQGKTQIPMINGMVMNCINIAGNFFLIFPTRTVSVLGHGITIPGAGLGVKGAAIATAMAICISGISMFLIVNNKKLEVHVKYSKKFRFRKQTIFNILKIGLPTSGERCTINLGMLVFQALIAKLGTIPLSAHYLSNLIESLSYMPAEGFSLAATTLVGQSIGAGKKEDAVIYSKVNLISAALIGAFCGLIFIIAPSPIFSLFSSNPDVISQGSSCLRLMGAVEPFLAMSIVLSGVFRGSGNTKTPFIVSLIGMWGVRILTAWFFAHHLGWGLVGAWLGMGCDQLVRFGLSFTKFLRKKWLDTKVRMD